MRGGEEKLQRGEKRRYEEEGRTGLTRARLREKKATVLKR